MKKKFLKILFSLPVAFILMNACSDSIKDNTSESKYKYESFENDPMGVRIYTLDNGLKVYLSVNKDKPRVQTAIAVRAGSKNDPSDCTGLAHYLEHMMFKGTSKIASLNWEKEKVLLQQISDLFEKHKATDDAEQKDKIYIQIDSLSQLAASYCAPNEYDKMVSSLGAKRTNAFTSLEQTVYINDLPTNELDKWMKLESERFSELTLRLFHTELEAVYEEFNRGQDNDYSKVYQMLDSLMYSKHPYGRSTIGLGEHLKNPSMVRIHKFFNTYYVPNNMAIIIAGDLNPDSTIKSIDKYFSKLKSGNPTEFKSPVEDPITEPVEAEVFGPMSEWITMGYRFSGIHGDEWPYLRLVSDLLSNGQAGLMDINLLQKQKLLRANAYYDENNDYSQFVMTGNPKQGQSLEDVKSLLLDQIELIKKGDFEDWMLDAVIKNYKLDQERWNESNFSRAMQMMQSFIFQIDWNDKIHQIDKMGEITKDQLVKWVNEHFTNNYITVYKRNGQDKQTYKVPKPHITPIDVNRDQHSAFYESFDSIQPGRLNPVFVDYKKDIKKLSVGSGIPFSYIENKTNHIFSLYYLLDMGTNNDEKIQIAIKYLPYLGTEDMSAEEFQKEFYRLGLSFDVFTGEDRTYVTLNGLEESLQEGVRLFETLLNNAKADPNALKELVRDIIKEREDATKNKWIILQSAMYNYARYGAKSPFTDKISNDELTKLDPEELVEKIKSINKFKHRIFYYGQNKPETVVDLLNAEHHTPAELNDYPVATQYEELAMTENKVYYVDYDMVQTELMLISKDVNYDPQILPYISLFNEYFGSGLCSIVFQEIREAKALAYSAWAGFSTPIEKDKSHYIRAYVGTQSDKLGLAVETLLGLMNNMPESKEQFEAAKISALKKIETDRITKTSIFWSSERARRLGLDHDIRKDIYTELPSIDLKDLHSFFDKHIKDKKYTYLAIGKRSAVDFKALEKLGTVKELHLNEIFGY